MEGGRGRMDDGGWRMEGGRGILEGGRGRMDHLKVSHLVIRVQSMALNRKMEKGKGRMDDGRWKVENGCQASLLFDPGDVLFRTALHGQV